MFIQRFVLMAALFGLLSGASAQTLRWGTTPRVNAGNRYDAEFLPTPDGGVHCITYEVRHYPLIYVTIPVESEFLEYYDQNLNLMVRNKLKMKDVNGHKLDVSQLLGTDDGQYIISSKYESNAATRGRKFYSSQLNMNTHLPSGQAQELFLAKNPSDWTIHQSFDRSKVVFMVDISDKKKEAETFKLVVFNSNFEVKLMEKDIVLPYTNKDFEISSVKVDNDGSVYLIGKRYTDRKHKSYVFTVLAYRSLGEDTKEYTVESGTLAIGDVTMGVNRAGMLVFAGLYAEESGSIAKGVIYFTIDPESRRVSRMVHHPFTADVLRAIGYRSEQVGSYSFNIKNFLLQDDGGCTLVGEESYSVVRTSTSTSSTGAVSTTSTTIYYRLGIIAVSMNGSGGLNWMAGIPKYGAGANTTLGLSYGLGVKGDKLYLVYNDNSDNLSYPESGKRIMPWRMRKGILALATIDGTGKVTRTSLGTYKETRTFVDPDLSTQVTSSRLLLPGRVGKRPRLGELAL